MEIQRHKWVQILYWPYFKMAAFLYRIYKGNRSWVGRIKSKKSVAGFMQAAMLVTLMIWLLIWFFASEESRNRLTDEFKESVQGIMPAENQ